MLLSLWQGRQPPVQLASQFAAQLAAQFAARREATLASELTVLSNRQLDKIISVMRSYASQNHCVGLLRPFVKSSV
jgi:hypothetical protein